MQAKSLKKGGSLSTAKLFIKSCISKTLIKTQKNNNKLREIGIYSPHLLSSGGRYDCKCQKCCNAFSMQLKIYYEQPITRVKYGLNLPLSSFFSLCLSFLIPLISHYTAKSLKAIKISQMLLIYKYLILPYLLIIFLYLCEYLLFIMSTISLR